MRTDRSLSPVIGVVLAVFVGLTAVGQAAEKATVEEIWAQLYDRPERLATLDHPAVCFLDIQHGQIIRGQLEKLAKPLEQTHAAKMRARLKAMSGLDCLVVHASEVTGAELERPQIKAILISGRSTIEAPTRDELFFDLIRTTRIPMIGFCGGCQLIGSAYGTKVVRLRPLRAGEADPNPKYHPGKFKEWGFLKVGVSVPDPLFATLPAEIVVKQAHAFQLAETPPEFQLLASTPDCQVQAIKHRDRPVYGVQFHPEGFDDAHPHGRIVLENFFQIALGAAATEVSRAADPVTLTADCSAGEGTLRRAERFNSDSLLRPPSAAMVRKMVAELGPDEIRRSWVYVDSYWDPATDRYDFDHPVAGGKMTFYEYLDHAAASGEKLLIDLRGPPLIKRALAGEIPLDKFREAVKRGLAHYRTRCSKIRYLEIFSEMRANARANDDQYYEIYRQVYRAVNEVNAELGLARGQELLLGGPAPCRYCDEVKALVERFARDPDPGKRLDFLVYHDYDRKGYGESLAHREAEVDAVLRANGLSTRLPIFITEMGCFSTSGALGDIGPDHVVQAACMCTLFYYYNQQPDCQAFHWVVQHKSNDRKTQILDDLSWTPYGCSLKMLKLLRPQKIRCDVAVEKARGVFSVASRDASSVAVMLWNYQHAGTESKRVALRVENLPESLAGNSVRLRFYLIDAVHSNCYHDPKQNDLQVVEERVIACERVCEVPVTLSPNALALVELLPAERP